MYKGKKNKKQAHQPTTSAASPVFLPLSPVAVVSATSLAGGAATPVTFLIRLAGTLHTPPHTLHALHALHTLCAERSCRPLGSCRPQCDKEKKNPSQRYQHESGWGVADVAEAARRAQTQGQ
ncbi:hypothetical protein GQ53DRAFT_68621 [Thozetella sp. PMI_491]|nr:hypothetical protein GQ53DRAFT_68621 [Thozetella sp. PMI_491]